MKPVPSVCPALLGFSILGLEGVCSNFKNLTRVCQSVHGMQRLLQTCNLLVALSAQAAVTDTLHLMSPVSTVKPILSVCPALLGLTSCVWKSLQQLPKMWILFGLHSGCKGSRSFGSSWMLLHRKLQSPTTQGTSSNIDALLGLTFLDHAVFLFLVFLSEHLPQCLDDKDCITQTECWQVQTQCY